MKLTVEDAKKIIVNKHKAIAECIAQEAMLWVVARTDEPFPQVVLFNAEQMVEAANTLKQSNIQSHEVVVGLITDYTTTEYVVFDRTSKSVHTRFGDSFH